MTRLSLPRAVRCALAAAVLFALVPASLLAQAGTLKGIVVDTTGAPLAGTPVVLHTVTARGGESIGSDTTDASGAFELRMPEKVEGESVVFAAVRLEGKLYIGPMMQGGQIPPGPYRIVAGGVSPLDAMGGGAEGGLGPATTPGAAAPDAGERSPLTLLVFVPLIALIAWFVFRSLGDRDRDRRRLLLELAEVEERLDAGGDADERAELEDRREALRTRLTAAPPSGAPAA